MPSFPLALSLYISISYIGARQSAILIVDIYILFCKYFKGVLIGLRPWIKNN